MKLPIFAMIAFVLTWLPAVAHAHHWTFCMKYRVLSGDSGVGEDYFNTISSTGTLWPALGARIELFDPATHLWTTNILTDDDTGCFEFDSTANVGFLIKLSSEHVLDGGDVVVRVLDSWANKVLKSWTIQANPGGNGGTFSFSTPLANEANLAAISTWEIDRIIDLGALDLPAATVLKVYDSDLSAKDNNLSGSGHYPAAAEIFVSDLLNHSQRKFLVAHEVGHWVHRRWGGAPLGGTCDYDYDDNVVACAFSGVGDHALRSLEESSCAWKEGVAHFLSAVTWNDHNSTAGVFKNYKYDGVNYFNETVQLDSAGSYQFNWYAHCTQEAGHAVEQDWMRHYWNYLTDAGVKPTLSDIATEISVLHDDASWTWANVYERAKAAVPVAFLTRWDNLAVVHGVDVLP